MKKITILILTLALTLSLTTPAFAADTLKEQANRASGISSFSDVPSSHWAHSAIMSMVDKGLFSGTTTPVNGVGTFAPDKTMTRAEFVVVVVRALYKSELDSMPAVAEGNAWWSNAYDVALEHGLLNKSELDRGNLSTAMNRQEMSMVLARACEQMGESKGQQISTSAIPDYNSIGTYYRDYVVQAYSKGMLAGTDSKGTFSPTGTLNRAQAATVLYRLVEPSSRQEVDFNKVTTPTQGQTQTWNEGQSHSEPKVGDTVIKADGTKVVLKEGYGGVLGAGQGVDIWTGVVLQNGNQVKDGVIVGRFSQRPFAKDSITGEMYTFDMWLDIMEATNPTGQFVGDYEGEVYNTWWQWTMDLPGGAWMWMGPHQ